MPDQWMPGAVARPVSYRGEAGTFAGTPLGWVLHVTVSNGSPYTVFQQAQSPNRRFSNFWVSKTGVIEQYTERTGKPWAQAAGNGTYWAVETEGFPNEPLTDAQIAALAQIHTWLGVVDQIADTPGQPGIGTHYMGGAAWGGHTCPDPSPGGQGPRSHQRQLVITAAQEQNMPFSDADKQYLYDQQQAQNKWIADRIDQTVMRTLAALPAQVVAALPPAASTGLTVADVENAVKSVVSKAAQASVDILGKA